MKGKRTSNLFARAAAARLVAAILSSSVSFVAAAADSGAVYHFNLPEQALSEALKAIGRQTATNILFDPDNVKGRTAPALRATLTAQQAIEQVLQGTSLVAKQSAADTVLVQPPAKDSSPQSALEKVVDIEEILVTGTHIRGARKSASPLLTFDRTDIQRTGFSTVDQFVESLPQNSGAGASQDVVGTDSAVGNDAYGNAINLRALGVGTTLVLLNGRRLAPGGNSGRFVDVSMIPLSAIDRIDVLTDGASAIYGSDAVGGVVNFVLKKDYEGGETGLRYGRVTEGGLREVQISQSLGTNWDGGGTMLAYEYNRRDALDASDRDFTLGNDRPRTLLPEQKRHSVYATAHQDLSDRWSVFADALYSQRDIENVLTYFSLLNEEAADAEELYAAGGADFAVTDNWRAQFVASYSRYSHDESFTRTALPDGEPDRQVSMVDNDVWSFDLLLDGSLITLPGGVLRLAVGASHRREMVDSLTLSDGETFLISPPERRVDAAFGELFIPLFGTSNRSSGVEALELTVAARYEDYNDFGDAVTPKFGIRWEPLRGLSLRGTYGESFKAPGLTQLVADTERFIALIPSEVGFSIPGDPLVLLRTQNARPQLHEEQSKSWTAGVDFEPDGAPFSFAVTYFDIEFKDRIDTPLSAGLELFLSSPQVFGDLLMANPSAEFITARLQPPASGVEVVLTDLTGGVFAPDTVGLWADGAITNISLSKQSGVDVVFDYKVETRAGVLNASLNGTYITNFENQAAPRAERLDLLNLLNQPIDLRLRGGLTWSRSAISASLFANYQDDYESTDAASTPIASWTTFDGQLRYQFDAAAKGGVFDGVVFMLSVQNLFDKDPPFVAGLASPIGHFGFDPVNATPLGRFVAAHITKSW
jgi:iron complex outermembrane receptor protein